LELIELNAKARETRGKGAARKMRVGNAFPAIVYGAKKEPVMLSLDTAEFTKIIRDNGSTGLFFDLKIEGGIDKAVMLKEVQMDAFGLEYLHVDLHEVDMDQSVTVTIPVEPTGESAGVKEGGMLQLIRRELDVVCKPADMPESIAIDITDLNVGDSVHVEDIDLGDAVEIPHDVNFTVITIVPPTADTDDEVSEEDEDLLEEVEGEEAEPVEE